MISNATTMQPPRGHERWKVTLCTANVMQTMMQIYPPVLVWGNSYKMLKVCVNSEFMPKDVLQYFTSLNK